MNRECALSRGLTETVTASQGEETARLLTSLRQKYGAQFHYNQESGLIQFN